MNEREYERALIEIESVCAEIYIVAKMMQPKDAIEHILSIFDKRYSDDKNDFDNFLEKLR
jgi:hypothetical protein|tara:strand:+ start:1211 stop:1390 length:180 start_codon:yes stop_codon:yes gene_type:complete